jgi:hypothetical protein
MMQEFQFHFFDQAGRPIQVIPALAETETIALVRAAHLASETGAADFAVETFHRSSPVRARR